ncbi:MULTISPECIES: multidrug effflux MFS transporter [Shewanella]|uniref:Bcr/CflA family efflux transporter n=1 Tax=Shewanella putrefaciens (strain CN-32 / ATCC BAA-453) TaxID=319224 RepID=A4Y7C4_SHEPC|nr:MULTISPECIES: multidrug effflux MFS transporter [Shewanella]MCK7634112.1 multidrug effflux MFS transporter [Shewanella sp. JNE17]MCK7649337.1 multidrug effflux MFS transporter [Shewanella sp. JNE8]MCK7657508.1 multidrug effflux MFS transporter [Shewanella sp. JNE4-2]QGS49725.1 Bcr/CflA family efflux MFS transporter [Shewanella putrefaciens]UPO29527.1 multidrug effflux MFS transporter [Shewanella sp. JNE2]
MDPQLQPSSTATNIRRIPNLGLLIPMLAAIVAITPLAIDMYLPAMSTLALSFHTDITTVQQSLSIYLAGYALGMLCFGPLADRIGRRPMVIMGLSGFMLTSFLIGFAAQVEIFLGLRFLQAFIGAAATVVVPGYIKEVYGDNTAKGMSYVSLIMMLAPLLAPSIGSLILELGEWHLIFFIQSAYAALLLLMVIILLKMPSDKDQDTRSQKSFLGAYATVFSRAGVKLNIASGVLTSFAFFCYLTASPFIYMEVFDLDKSFFAILFSINVGALMLANILNTRVIGRYGSLRMLHVSTFFGALAGVGLLAVNLLELSYHFTVMMLIPLMGCLGIMSVNADAIVLMKFKQETGTATAVIGTLRFGCGALAGPLLAVFYNGTAVPFSALMLAAVVLVGICQWNRPKHKAG